jgi:hypothetical protein
VKKKYIFGVQEMTSQLYSIVIKINTIIASFVFQFEASVPNSQICTKKEFVMMTFWQATVTGTATETATAAVPRGQAMAAALRQ